MRAMILKQPRTKLEWTVLPDPRPSAGEVRIRVTACGVCRTDLHVVDGELSPTGSPIIPGHEIVGRVEMLGDGVTQLRMGQRVGVPWLGWTCGTCPYCAMQRENLCDRPLFTGYSRDGGFATHTVADARYVLPLGEDGDDAEIAPLLCAGLIGWRALRAAGDAPILGIYGFGAAAHIVAQVALRQRRTVFAFTRPGDLRAQSFARKLGATWAGGSDDAPPRKLDAAIIFAPSGDLVPKALADIRKGGRVVCAGIHMSEIPAFSYDLLWGERELVSVANLTRQDGLDFLELTKDVPIQAHVTRYALADANRALDDLRAGRFEGAAVLAP